MPNERPQPLADLGVIGLGVMGRNLALNLADHGFSVAGHDKDPAKVEAFCREAGALEVHGAADLPQLVGLLRQPRAVMMMVPAGAPVDALVDDLLALLQPGDLIVDGGNSYFEDTNWRAATVTARGLQFLGVGVSGGEHGARHGPSLMPGGPVEAYERVRPLFEAAAAHVNGEPCVALLGPGSAGHYVKMVHDGLEVGVMQLIAETYDLMKRSLGLTDDELHNVYELWSVGALKGYLVEITAGIFAKQDPATEPRLTDKILDVARNEGTARWTSQGAMELHVPVPTIDAAVAMRDLSALAQERDQASQLVRRAARLFGGDRDAFVSQLGRALHAAIAITYAQGFALLRVASDHYGYHLDLAAVARLWQGGCILRASLLDAVGAALQSRRELPNLLLDPDFSRTVMDHQEALRQVVCQAVESGVPIPGLMVSLAYLDAYGSAWLPINLIQAQGTFHTARNE